MPKTVAALAARASSRRRRAHPWPQPGASLLIFAVVFIWATQTSLATKLRAFLGATLFSPAEILFTLFTRKNPDGSVVLVNPFSSGARQGHTTPHQWVINIFCLPIALDLYFALVPPGLARALLFPLSIWLVEIVEGYILIYLYGFNPAWEYHGRDAFCNGTIKLSFAKYWLPLGALLEYVVWPPAYQWTTIAALWMESLVRAVAYRFW